MADRSHLSIGEVLSLLQDEFPDVTISKIRFLESQGLLDPERTPSGYRKFYESDVRRLRWILTEQRDSFLPLKVIKDRLDDGVDLELASPDPSGNGAAAAIPPGDGGAAAPPAPEAAPPTATPAPPAPASDEQPTLPIWMADAARAKVDRGRDGRSPVGDGPDPLSTGPTTVSLSADELLAASGLSRGQLASLVDFGLLAGHTVADDRYFDGDDLVVAQKAAAFLAHGVEARHLRMYLTTAEREADLLAQLVLPQLKQRSAESRDEARTTVAELATSGQALRAALLRRALGGHLG